MEGFNFGKATKIKEMKREMRAKGRDGRSKYFLEEYEINQF